MYRTALIFASVHAEMPLRARCWLVSGWLLMCVIPREGPGGVSPVMGYAEKSRGDRMEDGGAFGEGDRERRDGPGMCSWVVCRREEELA